MDIKGKKINFLGDSITYGAGVNNQELRFDRLMCTRYGAAEAFNFGISGTRLAYQLQNGVFVSDNSFSERVDNLRHDADITVVFGGTNDYGHGTAPFGIMTDLGKNSYCGAIRYILKKLRDEYPGQTVIFMTPMRRKGGNSVYGKVNGLPLRAYCDAIIEACKEFGVTCIDLYNELGIDPDIEADRERYVPDGLHPNEAGHAEIAKKLIEVIEKIPG